ncbi:thiol-disulfide oxidoreductase DCC family protein [Staphylococcus simulans]|uniref:thiol-disulfide oxidoreductase DCC family protein n=1 Tax=Staphylococcus simulans TaxID=1286 RepID=UPI000D09A0F6
MNKVIIYDNECSMCSTFIRILLKLDANSSLYFTDRNSNWTYNNLSNHLLKKDSIIYIRNNEIYLYSDAILNCLADANPIFKLVLVLKYIKKNYRDKIYKFIASRRHFLNNKKTTCNSPNNHVKKMYLY